VTTWLPVHDSSKSAMSSSNSLTTKPTPIIRQRVATRCLIIGVGFGVKLSDEDIADFEVLRDVAMATVFGFL